MLAYRYFHKESSENEERGESFSVPAVLFVN